MPPAPAWQQGEPGVKVHCRFSLGKAHPYSHPEQGNKGRELFSKDFVVWYYLQGQGKEWGYVSYRRRGSDTWRSLLGPGKEWAPRGRAMSVLLRAGTAKPAVAVGTEDVSCPLLLAL